MELSVVGVPVRVGWRFGERPPAGQRDAPGPLSPLPATSAGPLAGADRRVWSIAGPSVLAYFSGALVGIVDIWAIGHLSDEAPLAGLAVGAFVITTIYMVFRFLYMSTIGLVAQSFGARRRRDTIAIALRAFVMSIGLGMVILAFSGVIASAAVAIWDPSPKAVAAARTYLEIRLFSVPAMFVNMAILGFLIGTQRARVALYLELFLNGVNVALTLWFVLGLLWGVKGAALGSLIAEWAAAAAGLTWVLYLLRPARAAALMRHESFWRIDAFREQASINGFLLIRTLFIQLVFAILSVSGARLGDAVLAANHVLLQMVFIASLGLMGMSSAAQALVGEAKGLGDRSIFHFWSGRTAVWSFVVGLAYALVYAIGGPTFIALFTDVESVRAAANEQVLLVVVWPVLAVWSYQLEGIFIGATAAKQMMWCAGAAAVAFVVMQWLLLPLLGNQGLWIAFILFFGVRALSLAACYPVLARTVPAPVS